MSGYRVNIFLISPRKYVVDIYKKHLMHSLEAPHQGNSNEYPQHADLLMNTHNICGTSNEYSQHM